MKECQECGEQLESANTPHDYGDCLLFKERQEGRELERAEWLAAVDGLIHGYETQYMEDKPAIPHNTLAGAVGGLEELKTIMKEVAE